MQNIGLRRLKACRYLATSAFSHEKQCVIGESAVGIKNRSRDKAVYLAKVELFKI